jgi:basic membrane protein A
MSPWRPSIDDRAPRRNRASYNRSNDKLERGLKLPPGPRVGLLISLAAAVSLAWGCNPTTPTAAPTSIATAIRPFMPTPLPNPVESIALVGAVGENQPGSRSALAWQGVQQAAGVLGAASNHVYPVTAAELYAVIPAAAPVEVPAGVTVVVTVGPAGAQATLAVASQRPSTLFLVLDQTMPESAPANVHGLVFDDVEAGYLAGYVAASASLTGNVGFVAGLAADPSAAAYLAGLRSGALQLSLAATVSPAYAGADQDPQKGRAAVDSLVASGAGAIVAMPDLTGYGAMRQACAHEIPVVALATDAALLLPDVRSCLALSILRRYDLAVRDAILGYAMGHPLPRVSLGTVASGGIQPGPFARHASPELANGLQDVLAAMRAGPPRPTPTPAESSTSAAPSSST